LIIFSIARSLFDFCIFIHYFCKYIHFLLNANQDKKLCYF